MLLEQREPEHVGGPGEEPEARTLDRKHVGAALRARLADVEGTVARIAAELVEVKVRLEKESEDVERIVADRLEMRVSPKQKEGAGGGVIFGG